MAAGGGARLAGGIDDHRLQGEPRALSPLPCLGPPCLRPAARTQPSLCPHLPSPALTYPHLPSPPSPTRPQALHNLVMYATDLALHPGGTEGVAYVGTAFATYTGLNVLIVLLAALLTLWAPSAGRWIDT